MPIKRLTLNKIPSFNDTTVELGPLNVLIGPNAVGKSNLIEILGLLQAMPTNISAAILRGGGIRQWLWLGDGPAPPAGTLQCEMVLPKGHPDPLLYSMSLTADSAGGPAIGVEHLGRMADVRPDRLPTFFSRTYGSVDLQPQMGPAERRKAKLEPAPIHPGESVFSQFKNPADKTPITAVGRFFEQIRIYREFRTGQGAGSRYGRRGQPSARVEQAGRPGRPAFPMPSRRCACPMGH